MKRITIPLEKCSKPRKFYFRRWPSVSVVMILIGIAMVGLAWVGH